MGHHRAELPGFKSPFWRVDLPAMELTPANTGSVPFDDVGDGDAGDDGLDH